MLTSEWVSGGIKRTLTTIRKDQETIDQLIARHDSDLAAALQKYPKDP